MYKKIISITLCFVLILTVAAGCGRTDSGAGVGAGSNIDSSIDISSGSGTDSSTDSSKDVVSNSASNQISTTLRFSSLNAGEERSYKSDVHANTVAGRTNDILLFNNPDRGYRTTMPVVIYPDHPDPNDPSKASTTCDLIKRKEDGSVVYNSSSKCNGKHNVDLFYANMGEEYNARVMDYLFTLIYFKNGKSDYTPKLILLQATLWSFNKTETLPQSVFDILQLFLDRCRDRKCKVLFRYGYHIIQVNWRTSAENRRLHEQYGASEEIMIKHIEQFAPFITKNIDIIHKMSSGVIGSGGEMALGYQYPQVNYDNIIKAIVEKICVPNNIYYTVRMPAYKLNLVNNDPDYRYAKYIGFNNDAMFGETDQYGCNSGCYQYGHNFNVTRRGQCEEHDLGGTHKKNDWWEYVCQTAAYTPQSGEIYHNLVRKNPEKSPTGIEMIKEVAHQRYTTMSHWNSYIEASFSGTTSDGKRIPGDSVMQRWIDNEVLTPEMLKENGIIYDPAWFYDENGKLVKRNAYEFIRDHLGYRVSAQILELNGTMDKSSSLSANLELKNYGFAAAFNMESGFAILDKNYTVVSTVKAGEPSTWYSHDPDNYRSTNILEHSVKANLKLPNKSGTYYIAFYLKNTMNDFARLSNELSFENGYNILHKIEIK